MPVWGGLVQLAIEGGFENQPTIDEQLVELGKSGNKIITHLPFHCFSFFANNLLRGVAGTLDSSVGCVCSSNCTI